MDTSGCTVEWRIMVFEQIMKKNHISPEVYPIEWLKTTDYFSAPASKGHHANYPGGLFDHHLNTLQELLRLTRNHTTEPWGRAESPFIIATLHDVTKLGLYLETQDMNPNTKEMERVYITNPDYVRNGHGADSVAKLLQHMNLTKEEQLCIRYHMGAYETEDWDGFDKAIRLYPNVLWTHTADMIASKVLEK